MSLEDELKNYNNILRYTIDCEAFIKEVLQLDVEWFHKEWLDLINDNDFVSLLAPRGHGKSTIIGAYVIWRILQDTNIRILQVTINQDKANEMMMFVQNALTTNETILDIWGNIKNPAEWSKSAIRVLRRQPGTAPKEPTLQVLGVTSSMVGGHYDLIILDDITDAKNSRTENRRRDLVNWYNMTLLPMLEPEGKIISIGTKWHELDIHSYFQKQDRYTCSRHVAILDDEKGEVLWPNRWTYKKLMEIKNEVGTASFYMQYQNEVVSDEDAIIKWDWITRSYDGYKFPEQPYKVYMGVDLSSSGEEADYFSISVIVVKDGKIYLVDSYRGHHTLSEQFREIMRMDQRWRPRKIGIDSAAQQKSIVEHIVEKNPSLPIVPVKPSIVNDRMSRVQRLSVFFEQDRIYMDSAYEYYADELTMFPRGAHDDSIDSLCFALEAANFGAEKMDWSRVPNLITARHTSSAPITPSRSKWNVIKV